MRPFCPVVVWCLIGIAFAQDEVPTKVSDQNRTGDIPYSSSVSGPVDRVDLSTGNLIVEIPIESVPGRGMNY